MDPIGSLAITLICINYLLFLPLSILCTLRIRKHCKEPHFQKRYPNLLYYIVLFAVLYICIDRTLYLFINVIFVYNNNNNILNNIEIIFCILVLLIFLSCFFKRTWLLYYDHNYHLGRSDKWRRNVGSVIQRKNYNWFDKSKKK
eukprot:185602_1